LSVTILFPTVWNPFLFLSPSLLSDILLFSNRRTRKRCCAPFFLPTSPPCQDAPVIQDRFTSALTNLIPRGSGWTYSTAAIRFPIFLVRFPSRLHSTLFRDLSSSLREDTRLSPPHLALPNLHTLAWFSFILPERFFLPLFGTWRAFFQVWATFVSYLPFHFAVNPLLVSP